MRRRARLPGVGGGIVAAAVTRTARTQTAARPVRIGAPNDLSALYSGRQGPGSVFAAETAVVAFGGRAAGVPVEVVLTYHRTKPDIGAAVSHRWLDLDGLGVILDVPNARVARVVAEFCLEKKKASVGSQHPIALP